MNHKQQKKYFLNVYCVITYRSENQDMQASQNFKLIITTPVYFLMRDWLLLCTQNIPQMSLVFQFCEIHMQRDIGFK